MGMRSERVFTTLIGVVSLVLLVGMVVTIEGGLLEYPGAVVRLALLCASLLLLALMFRRDAFDWARTPCRPWRFRSWRFYL